MNLSLEILQQIINQLVDQKLTELERKIKERDQRIEGRLAQCDLDISNLQRNDWNDYPVANWDDYEPE